MSPDARRTRRPRSVRFENTESLAVKPQRESRGRTEKARSSTWLGGHVLNPHIGFLVLCGIGVATFRLEPGLRLTLLWLVLLVLVLIDAESGRFKASYGLLNLGRGVLVGVVVALPFYLFAKDFFHATASLLYGVNDLLVLLERVVVLVPILEEFFFRGVVQRERGLLEGALFFGLAQALYFIPVAGGFPLVVGAFVLGMALLGLLYGYLYQRYGLTTSIACHVAVSFVLLVLPPLAARIGMLMG